MKALFRKTLFCLLFLIFFWTKTDYCFADEPPEGHLDKTSKELISGCVKDPDNSSDSCPVTVHIHIDRQLVKSLKANLDREGCRRHAFSYTPTGLSDSYHLVEVFAESVGGSCQPESGRYPLAQSPQAIVSPERFSLTSGQIEIVANSRYGGAITEVYDRASLGNQNLIDLRDGGRLLQPAFWDSERHDLYPGCLPLPDHDRENPTQGGWDCASLFGNNIIGRRGLAGQNSDDPKEFIRHENSNQLIHLKSQFGRWDYCTCSTPESSSSMWDTPWYLEQWISFHPTYRNVLVIRSKITNEGSSPDILDSRQLPIMFTHNLTRVAYWQGGVKKIENIPGREYYFITPDRRWAAFLSASVEAGIGIAVPQSYFCNNRRFAYGWTDQVALQANIFPHCLQKFLEKYGVLSGATPVVNSEAYSFSPGGSFLWTTYFPIGTLTEIKASADALIPADPVCTPTTLLLPTGLAANSTCNRATISWNPVNGANFYSLRVDDQADPFGAPGTCFSPNGDFCLDLVDNSYTFNVQAGHRYDWWVVGVNCLGQSEGATHHLFTAPATCGSTSTPTPTSMPSLTATPSPACLPLSSFGGCGAEPCSLSQRPNWVTYNPQPFCCNVRKFCDHVSCVNCVATPTPTNSPIPTPTPIPGDVDGNGQVNGLDVIMLISYLDNPSGCNRCDVDKSGQVNGLDVIALINYL